MSSPKPRLVLTFPSIHEAMAAERILKAKALTMDFIPVPRAISSACGFCLLLDFSTFKELQDALEPKERSSLKIEASYIVGEVALPGTGRKEKHYERESQDS